MCHTPEEVTSMLWLEETNYIEFRGLNVRGRAVDRQKPCHRDDLRDLSDKKKLQ